MKFKGNRLLSLILVLALLLFAVSSGLYATGSTLTVSNVTGPAGQVLAVPVSLTSDGSVSGLQFDLQYDPAFLTFQGATAGAITQGFSVSANPVPGGVRVVVFSFAGNPILAGSGTAVAVSFTLNSSIPNGYRGRIEIVNAILSDTTANDITGLFQISGGFFTAAGMPGDVNSDNRVDIHDLQAVAQVYGLKSSMPGYLANRGLDLNQDGTIDLYDLIITARNYGTEES